MNVPAPQSLLRSCAYQRRPLSAVPNCTAFPGSPTRPSPRNSGMGISHPLHGFDSPNPSAQIQNGPLAHFVFVVEMMGIEPMSESIFTVLSPSASYALLFRFINRP